MATAPLFYFVDDSLNVATELLPHRACPGVGSTC